MKNILVVGGAANLVQPTLERWARDGHRLALTGRDSVELKGIADRLNQRYGRKIVNTNEMSNPGDEAQIQNALNWLGIVFTGQIDAMVVTTGAVGGPEQKLGPGQSIGEIDLQQWRQNFEVNLWPTLSWVKHVGAKMMTRPTPASIVVFDSISAHDVLSRVVPYGGAKSAQWQMCRAIGFELAQQRVQQSLPPISVNAITPGFFITEQNAATLDAGRKAAILNRTPLARFGTPEDLVESLNMLAVNPGFMNLTEIFVDGGFHGFSGISPNPVPIPSA